MRLDGYVRVSRVAGRSGDAFISPGEQKERVRAWAKSQGHSIAKWHEDLYNAVGFPRVFYLRYHGYSALFPLWALARHANLMPLNDRTVRHGM